jgi:TPR repeat protein
VERNAAAAAVQWRLAAEQGHAGAQAHLASALMHGEGVRADPAEALRLARASAAQGDVDGAFALGSFFREGAGGIGVDRREAARWFAKAAELGDEGAARALRELAAAGVAEAAAALRRLDAAR